MMSVRAERHSQEITLVSVFGKAAIGKVGDLIRLEIQNGHRLACAAFLGAVAVVQESRIMAIGT